MNADGKQSNTQCKAGRQDVGHLDADVHAITDVDADANTDANANHIQTCVQWTVEVGVRSGR